MARPRKADQEAAAAEEARAEGEMPSTAPAPLEEAAAEADEAEEEKDKKLTDKQRLDRLEALMARNLGIDSLEDAD